MGVRVRLSRNTGMYLPFWIAIPVFLGWLAVMVVVVVVAGLVKLAILAGHGIAALAEKRRQKQLQK